MLEPERTWKLLESISDLNVEQIYKASADFCITASRENSPTLWALLSPLSVNEILAIDPSEHFQNYVPEKALLYQILTFLRQTGFNPPEEEREFLEENLMESFDALSDAGLSDDRIAETFTPIVTKFKE